VFVCVVCVCCVCVCVCVCVFVCVCVSLTFSTAFAGKPCCLLCPFCNNSFIVIGYVCEVRGCVISVYLLPHF